MPLPRHRRCHGRDQVRLLLGRLEARGHARWVGPYLVLEVGRDLEPQRARLAEARRAQLGRDRLLDRRVVRTRRERGAALDRVECRLRLRHVRLDTGRGHRRAGERCRQADCLALWVVDRDARPPGRLGYDLDHLLDPAPGDAQEDVVAHDVELARDVALSAADPGVPRLDRLDERVEPLVVTAEERRPSAEALHLGEGVGGRHLAVDRPDDEIEGHVAPGDGVVVRAMVPRPSCRRKYRRCRRTRPSAVDVRCRAGRTRRPARAPDQEGQPAGAGWSIRRVAPVGTIETT